MTCIAAPDASGPSWARDHGIDGFDGAEWRRRLRGDRGASWPSPSRRSIPPKDEVHPSRRGRAGLGGGVRPGATRSTAATVALPVRLPGAARSSRGMRAHLATAYAAGARIVPGAAVDRVARSRRGRAVGRRGDGASDRPRTGARAAGAPVVDRGARRPRPAGRPRGGRAPDAGVLEGRASITRRSGGTCASIPCRSSPASTTSRSTCGADRCRPPDRWRSRSTAPRPQRLRRSNRRPATRA